MACGARVRVMNGCHMISPPHQPRRRHQPFCFAPLSLFADDVLCGAEPAIVTAAVGASLFHLLLAGRTDGRTDDTLFSSKSHLMFTFFSFLHFVGGSAQWQSRTVDDLIWPPSLSCRVVPRAVQSKSPIAVFNEALKSDRNCLEVERGPLFPSRREG